jgi:hypothetical protein
VRHGPFAADVQSRAVIGVHRLVVDRLVAHVEAVAMDIGPPSSLPMSRVPRPSKVVISLFDLRMSPSILVPLSSCCPAASFGPNGFRFPVRSASMKRCSCVVEVLQVVVGARIRDGRVGPTRDGALESPETRVWSLVLSLVRLPTSAERYAISGNPA